jgi:uncharacterized protein YrrD
MIKGNEFIGKPVCGRDGLKMGSVQRVVIDRFGGRIVALMVDGEGGTDDPRAIPFETIESMGTDAIIVVDGVHGLSLNVWTEIGDLLNEPPYQGRDVMSTSGTRLGTLAELCFDEVSGQLEGIEISKGVLSDLQSRTFIPSNNIVVGETIMVEPLALEDSTVVDGTLSQAVKNVGATVGLTANETLKSVTRGASEVLDRAKIWLAINQTRYAIGREASSDVTGIDQQIIVRQGETISEAQANLAAEHGALAALFLSAGGGGIRMALESSKNLVSGVLEKIRNSLAKDVQTIGLEATIGYIASRTVYGAGDEPIIAAGETVTLETIERASSQRFEADLLNAVFGELNAKPSFDDITDDPKAELAVLALDTDGNPNVHAEDEVLLHGAIGEIIQHSVHDANGETIVKAGTVMTSDLLEQARTEAILPELTVALSNPPSSPSK